MSAASDRIAVKGNEMRSRILTCLLVLLCRVATSSAAETLSVLDLVSDEVAFCVEMPDLDTKWPELEKSPLMARLRAFPAIQKVLDGNGFQRWMTLNDLTEKKTGQPLSTYIHALFARSLVVAVYVPPNGAPQGIVVGEARDPAAIQSFFQTWNLLEPKHVTTTRFHRGLRYKHRKRHADTDEELYFASSDRWFAITDQESLIQGVIDRFIVATATTPEPYAANTLRFSPAFIRNRARLKPGCAAYVHINARPWDRSLQEFSQIENDPLGPAAIWKNVSCVAASINLKDGIVCDSVVDLDSKALPKSWPQFVATAKAEPSWKGRLPADAILAVSGHLELAPLVQLILNQIPAESRAEIAKIRRVAQSFLRGRDLIDTVLPAMSRDFSAFLVTRAEAQGKKVVVDGAFRSHLNSSSDPQMVLDISRGMETTMTLLAAYFSADTQNLVVAFQDRNDTEFVGWLSDSAPIPLACGVKQNDLFVAGSRDRARQSMDLKEPLSDNPRLTDHARRYFPDANQLIWLDSVQARTAVERNGNDLAQFFSFGVADAVPRWVSRFEQIKPTLELVDSFFIAAKIEIDHLRITFGGGLDTK